MDNTENKQTKQASGMPKSQVQCGWCRSSHPYPLTNSNCSNCGGPLPNTNLKLGKPPPAIPRKIPKQFLKNVKWTNSYYKVSLLFMVMGIPFIPFMGLGLIPCIIGFFLYKETCKKIEGRLHALKKGCHTEGRITAIYLDKNVQILGKSPGKVEYVFRSNDGIRHFDFKVSSNTDILAYDIGESIWVVYIKENPKLNDIWPPIA